MPRTRARGVRAVESSLDLYLPGSGWGQGCPVNRILIPRKFSAMSDNVGHSFWQACNHVSMSYDPGQVGTFPAHGDHTDASSGSPPYFTVQDACLISAALLPAARGTKYAAWVADLYELFTDQFPDQFSLANTLLEFRNGIGENIPLVSDLRERISSNYLKIKFGIMPFIKDLKEAVNLYSNFKKRLSFLKENAERYVDRRRLSLDDTLLGGWFVRDYDTSLQLPPPPPPIIDTNEAVHHPLRVTAVEEWSECVHTATAFVSNQLRGLDNVSRQVDAMASMAGLTNPTKVAWNAIPWTWLCDWFIDMNHILDRMEGQPFEGKLALDGVYVSSKVRTQMKVVTSCTGSGWSNLQTGQAGTILFRVYDRSEELTIDEGSLVPQLIYPSLTGSQEAILLALVDQRCRAVPDVVKLLRRYRR